MMFLERISGGFNFNAVYEKLNAENIVKITKQKITKQKDLF